MSDAYQHAVEQFLLARRIAIFGYSSTEHALPGNYIFDKLRKHDYEVFAINPRLPIDVEQGHYRNLAQVPGPIDAAVIATPPGATLAALESCHTLGVKLAWLHRSVDQGSYLPAAEAYARQQGITLITGGCPMMFLSPDIAHRCLRWVAKLRGVLEVQEATATVQ